MRGPLSIVTGNHRNAEGLQISLEKNPIPTLPHTPMASRVEMMNWLTSPDSSARAPAFATPSSKLAPGIGTFARLLPRKPEKLETFGRSPALSGQSEVPLSGHR